VNATRLGKLLFALAFAALGALNLAWGLFTYVWQPVPKWLPWRQQLAYVSGVMVLGFALGMLVRSSDRVASLLMTVNVLLWTLLTRLPAVLADPGVPGHYEELGETMILLGGVWALWAAAAGNGRRSRLESPEGVRVARYIFALALPMMGFSHFAYLKYTASMIPGWIPFHVGFVYLTGAAHIAAGLGLLFGVVPRLAATAEAAMITIFALFANTAGVLAQPGSQDQWIELLVAFAMAGAAWAVAGSLADAPWGLHAPQARTAAASSP
jgi:uncharacterized membrane protein